MSQDEYSSERPERDLPVRITKAGESETRDAPYPWRKAQMPQGPGRLNDGACFHYVAEGPMIDVALFYDRLGWPVIPVRQNEERTPCVKWSVYQHQRPDEHELHRWFVQRFKDAGLAVINGKISGWLVCRDFDDHESYEKWASAHPDLAALLPTVRTRRGWHVYFLNSALVKTEKGRTGELRCTGINALPPTRRDDGFTYSWLILPTKDNLIFIEDVEGAGLWDFEKEKVSKESNQKADGRQVKKSRSDEIRDESEAVPRDYLPRLQPNPRPRFRVEVDGELGNLIDTTLPTAPGQRNQQIFEFVRHLKALPVYAEMDPLAFQDVVREWHGRALPKINTKAFEETWCDFLYGWDKVRWPKGIDPFVVAAKAYQASGEVVDLDDLDDPKLVLLAGICRELQRMTGESPFFVACNKAGEFLGVSPATAWRYLYLLERVGVIACARRGRPGGRHATRYWYVGATDAD